MSHDVVVNMKGFTLNLRTTLFFGINAIKSFRKIAEYIVTRDLTPLLIITGKSSYKKCGAWEVVKDILESFEIEYAHYDGVSANPTVDMIQAAFEFGNGIGAKSVLGIGGGSVIDVSKATATLLANRDISAKDLYLKRAIKNPAVPIFAINTTHGTGTEVDRFAVATVPEEKAKISIAHESIYPTFSIDDPTLTVKLPKDQTIYVTIDALSHALESMTSKHSNPFTVTLAIEAAHRIFENLPKVLDDLADVNSRYWLLYASMVAGITLDNSRAHLAHALEHPISAVKPKVPHGLGLALLLPVIIEHTYKVFPKELSMALRPIAQELRGDPKEAKVARKALEEWISSLGVNERLSNLGFNEDTVDELVEIAFRTMKYLIGMTPYDVTEDLVREIYMEIL
ncbi:MAG: alcohol dehydrogenase [Thermoplasmata archaeon]|nr:iron-containing alcohol dehydrogenase [Euryarchaeota archaeon]RLF66225.1 MAG: alcohol dehydrogenase [Thermoplasmata archaeon]